MLNVSNVIHSSVLTKIDTSYPNAVHIQILIYLYSYLLIQGQILAPTHYDEMRTST